MNEIFILYKRAYQTWFSHPIMSQCKLYKSDRLFLEDFDSFLKPVRFCRPEISFPNFNMLSIPNHIGNIEILLKYLKIIRSNVVKNAQIEVI